MTAPTAERCTTFSIETRQSAGGICLSLTGEIDMSAIGQLDRAIAQALRTAPASLLVNLADCTFCDCTGITALIIGRRDALAGGVGYQVINPTGLPLQVLRILGVHTMLTTPSGQEGAVTT